ncbi:MAG: hemolysin family protein [Nitriliruptorales bacterium]
MIPVVLAAEAEELAINLPVWQGLLIGAALLAANAFFVAAEIGLLAVRRARVEELAEAGDGRAVRVMASLRELSLTFSGAQLGITLASLGLGAVAEPAVVVLLAGLLDVTGLSTAARTGIAFGVGLAIVVFLHMVVGEMVPKNIALARPEAVSLRVVRALRAFVLVLRPVVVALNATANGLVRLVGVTPRSELSLVHTPGELALLLRESRREGTLPAQEERVLTAALGLGAIDAGAAMTSRVDLEALPDTATLSDVLVRANETGFTRFPVFHEVIDDIVGMVNVKDVLTSDETDLDSVTVAEILRPIPAVPESRDLETLLRDMRRDRSHAVVVVDEFGGTAGLVTLEDVLEELVGEISDEFDPTPIEPRQVGPGDWVVAGTLRRDELEQHTGCRLEGGASETVSGYLTERLGRLVQVGDEVTSDDWRLRVRTVQGRRAGEVEVVAPEGSGPAQSR